MCTYWSGHLHEHIHTRIHAKANNMHMWNDAWIFPLGDWGKIHLSPLGNSCFRQNNKQLNDIVSCPLWLQSGNGTTSLRPKLQIANLYNCPLFLFLCSLSCASTETLADLKGSLILIESCWSVLKRQSITTYQEIAWRRRGNEKTEKKLCGHESSVEMDRHKLDKGLIMWNFDLTDFFLVCLQVAVDSCC